MRFDALTRGLYANDASIYQIAPIGVVLPRTLDDVGAAMEIAREEGVPVLPRGAGTSQCGQTVGRALVIDTSRHLDRILEIDREARTARVEPGVVLDHLNRRLAPTGLFFPVDVATASRATIGGMAGNNSGGGAFHPVRDHGRQRAGDRGRACGWAGGAVRGREWGC